nr:type II secretion system protein GspJ [Deferrisoma camini]
MNRGFTLIEVVVTLALLALVLSLVQGTYSGAVRSRDRSSQATAEVHQAALVLDRMATEISGALVSASRATATGFVVEPDADGNATLTFTTRLAPIPGLRPGGPVELRYNLEADDDGVLRLVRREEADPDEDPEEGGLAYPVLENVLRFQVLCYDGTEWAESWDSRIREEEPFLPEAVSLEIAWGPDENHERVLRTATPLYSRRRLP